VKVAVIGGGISGLCAAAALGRAGADVEVFERGAAIREIGAGLSLWPNATYALRELGLLEDCTRAASLVDTVRLRDPGGRDWLCARIRGGQTPALCLDRPALLSALLAAVDPRRIHVGHRCTGVSLETGRSGRPRVHFEGGRSLACDVVIGADGLGSVVRRFVTGRSERPVYRGYMIWRGVAPVQPPLYSAGSMTEAWGLGERFGIMPIGEGKVCWYAARSQAEAAAAQSQEELLRHFQGWHEPIAQVIAATPAAGIVRTPALDRPVCWRWSRGPVTLVGDAAHPMTPNLGQGTCQAIEDALVLSLLLARAGPIEAALVRFGRLRRARAAAVTLGARWLGRFAQSQGRAARLARGGLPGPLLSGAVERALRAVHDHRAGAHLTSPCYTGHA